MGIAKKGQLQKVGFPVSEFLETDGDNLYWRCEMGVTLHLSCVWLHNAQISSVKTNLVSMVCQWKVARHQFQGTSIRQVVLLDTMDQLRAELQPRWANLQSLTCLKDSKSINHYKPSKPGSTRSINRTPLTWKVSRCQWIHRIASPPQASKETDLQGKWCAAHPWLPKCLPFPSVVGSGLQTLTSWM